MRRDLRMYSGTAGLPSFSTGTAAWRPWRGPDAFPLVAGAATAVSEMTASGFASGMERASFASGTGRPA